MLFRRVGALILREKRLLLVSSFGKDSYWTPGGKRMKGETNEEALKRELKEELSIEVTNVKYYVKELDRKPHPSG